MVSQRENGSFLNYQNKIITDEHIHETKTKEIALDGESE